jgi:hypothetical protein
MMNSSDPLPTQTDKSPTLPGSPDLLLSLATVPVLLGIVTLKVVNTTLRQLGEMSEELFRGDRLPLLHFPDTNRPEPEDLSPN